MPLLCSCSQQGVHFASAAGVCRVATPLAKEAEMIKRVGKVEGRGAQRDKETAMCFRVFGDRRGEAGIRVWDQRASREEGRQRSEYYLK